ncbi:MAG: RHS repeat domain-containing protein [Bacteroidales bacterium]
MTDHLGTPIQAYDESGTKIWSRSLDIYGKVRSFEGDKTFLAFLFAGMYEDIETGLCYNRFRYYDPEMGMYISQDPIKLIGGFNLYSYVKDSNSWIDPFGLVEQGKDELGRFLPKNPGDSALGSDAVDDVVKQLEADPKTKVLGTEISFKDPETGQIRRYDIVTKDLDTGDITGVEVKNSETATYGKKQKDFDTKVNSDNHKIVPTGKKAKDAKVTKINDVKVIRCT